MSLQQVLGNALGGMFENGEDLNIRDFLSTIAHNTGATVVDQFWSPPLDIVNSETELCVYMEIPGVDLNTIDVDFFNNKLNIKGTRNKPYEGDATRKEIVYGQFEKKATLPISVTSRENVKVKAKNGILTIIIDKVKEGQNKFNVRLEEDNGDE